MLVVDLAHQLLQHVLQGHDAVGAAKLIQQDYQMGLRSPEQLEQVADGEAGRCKDRFLHDLRDLRAALVGLLVEILLVQDADDMVQVLMIHGYPGKPGVAEQVRSFLDGLIV